MSTRVQRRRGTAAAHASFIGAEGEITVATDTKRLVLHDGATAGGIPMARLDEVTEQVSRAIGNANFSFQITDRIVVPSASFTVPRTGTLPLASAVSTGRTISFFDSLPALNGVNVLTVVPSGSDTINGGSSLVLSLPRSRWDFVSDGISKWSVAAEKAPLASPALTGTPTAPTPAGGTNTTQIATTAFVKAAIDLLVASAPGALDTLNELAAALGNDANFAATVTTALAGKQPLDADLTALATLVSAANKLPYYTGPGAAALADLTAAGRAIIAAADAAAQRALLGQKWTAVYDTTLGAAAAAIDIPLTGGFGLYRLHADIVPNAAVADFNVLMRISKDGGSTYLAGSGDYAYWGRFDNGASVANVSLTVAAFGLFSSLHDTAFPAIGGTLSALLRQGSSSKRANVTSHGLSYDGSNYVEFDLSTSLQAAGAATHLRLIGGSSGNIFDTGTRVVVEGM